MTELGCEITESEMAERADHEHADHEHADHERPSFRAHLAEHRITVESMDPWLRASVGFGLASLLAVVALVGVRHLGGGSVQVGEDGSSPIVIPAPLFLVTLVLLAIGMSYLLTALTVVRSAAAALPVGALVLLIGLYTGAFGPFAVGGEQLLDFVAPWARWLDRAILAAILAVFAASQLLARRASAGTRRRPPAEGRAAGEDGAEAVRRSVVLSLYAALLGGYLAVAWSATSSGGASGLFGFSMTVLLATLFLPMVPLLAVAAVDFAEWGELAGAGLAAALTRRRVGLRAPLALLVSAVVSALGLISLGWGTGSGAAELLVRALGSLAAVGAAVALLSGAFLALRRRRNEWPQKLGFATLTLVCGAVFVVFPPLAMWFASSPPPATISAAGRFLPGAKLAAVSAGAPSDALSMDVPAGWRTTVRGGAIEAVAVAGHSGEIVSAGIGPAITPSEYAAALHVRVGASLAIGRWHGVSVSGRRFTGYLWMAPVPGTASKVATVSELATGTTLAAVRPVFLAVARSVRFPGEQPAPLPPPLPPSRFSRHDLEVGITLGLDLALALALAGGALARRGWRPQLAAASLLTGLIALYSALSAAPALGHLALGPATTLPALSPGGMLVGLGALGVLGVLGLVVAGKARSTSTERLLDGVVGLEAAAAVVELMHRLYDKAASQPDLGIAAAIVLAVAIAWDVLMSGSWTNEGTSRLSRGSRVLLYFGYVILLNGVLIFASHAVDERAGASSLLPLLRHPDDFTGAALFSVALPVLLVTFLLRSSGQTRTGAEQPAPARGEESTCVCHQTTSPCGEQLVPLASSGSGEL